MEQLDNVNTIILNVYNEIEDKVTQYNGRTIE